MEFDFLVIPDQASVMEIRPQGKLMVRVLPTGEIEYGEDYDPDEAARIFWNAIAKHMPAIIQVDTRQLIENTYRIERELRHV